MTVNFTGIKNITVGKLPKGSTLEINNHSLEAYGTKAVMYLDGKDLASMQSVMNGGNRLEVVSMRSKEYPEVSGLLLNKKPVLGCLNNLPLVTKLGNLFNKILKTPNEKINPEPDFLSNQAYVDVMGATKKIPEIKKVFPENLFKHSFASPEAVKYVSKEIINDIKTSIAFESKAYSDNLKKGLGYPVKDLPS